MSETIFTRIIRGEVPCHRVYEDEHVLAFLDIAPLAPGHTLVVPKEPAETLDAFFKKFDQPFPTLVATDVARKAFLAYGVSGTPTFVLVDAAGIVGSYSVGYSPGKGLGVHGWTWSGPPRSVGGGAR